jgi:hypothetical protein
VAGAELSAARLDDTNLASLRMTGPDAVSGLGDWALSNGTLCAGVTDPSHENDLSMTGGSLMDLGHCGRADDQFLIFEQLVNLSTRTLVPITSVAAEQGASEARLITRGARDGLVLETRYAVDLTEPTRLRVGTRLAREAEGERLFGFGSAYANVSSLTPFTLDTRARSFRSSGSDATRLPKLPCRRICSCSWATPVSLPASPTRCCSGRPASSARRASVSSSPACCSQTRSRRSRPSSCARSG